MNGTIPATFTSCCQIEPFGQKRLMIVLIDKQDVITR